MVPSTWHCPLSPELEGLWTRGPGPSTSLLLQIPTTSLPLCRWGVAVLGKLVSFSETSDRNPRWCWHKGDNRYPKRGLCLLVFSPLYDQIPDKKQEDKLILIYGLRIWSSMAGKAQWREWLWVMLPRDWGHSFTLRGWGGEREMNTCDLRPLLFPTSICSGPPAHQLSG